MSEFIIYILLLFFYIFWLYRTHIIFNLFIYLTLIYHFNTFNIIIQNANIYTFLINFISTIWTLNEHYIYIQLFFFTIFIYIFLMTKKNIKTLFIFFYNLLFVFLILNYTLLEYLLYIPKTITNYNIILTHTLVSIHPPLILISILLIRCLVLFFYLHILFNKNKTNPEFYKYCLIIYYVLSCSIILGSFWSINLFGWGGWWIWDPIENISLLYWLFILILIHIQFDLQNIIYICLFLFLYDYIFYCTFKLSLLNSLHIFKSTLITLNINYFFYLIIFYFFLYYLYYFYLKFKQNTIVTFSFLNMIYYVLFFLLIQYIYLLFIQYVSFQLYSNTLLNLIYIPLLYILSLEILKQINLFKFYFFYYLFFIIIITLFFNNNILLIILVTLLMHLLFSYEKIISYYNILHYFFVVLILLLILFEFNLYSFISSYTLNISTNNLNIITFYSNSLTELSYYNLYYNMLHYYQENYLSSIIINTNFDTNNLFQKNELNYLLSNIYNYLISNIFNQISIYKLLNIQYIIIATIFYFIYFIYYKYLIKINNKFVSFI